VAGRLGRRHGNLLVRGGFTTVEKVAGAPDIVFAMRPRMGEAALTVIRAVIAAQEERPEASPWA
jgi:hypothetical protein